VQDPEDNLTVLVVDPVPMVSGPLARLLKTSGHHVYTAENGHDAVTLNQEHPEIQVVLIDDNLPDIGAPSLARLLQVERAVPVIVMSSFCPQQVDDSIVAVLKKPFRMLRLRDRLREIADNRREAQRRVMAWSM